MLLLKKVKKGKQMNKKPLMTKTKAEVLKEQQYFINATMEGCAISRKEAEDKVWKFFKE